MRCDACVLLLFFMEEAGHNVRDLQLYERCVGRDAAHTLTVRPHDQVEDQTAHCNEEAKAKLPF